MFKNWKTIKEIKKLRKIPVRKEFLVSLRHRLSHELNYLQAKQSTYIAHAYRFTYAFALILLIVFGSGGAAFAQNSLPGELLYPVKLITEDIQENFIADINKKIGFREERVDRRFKEMEKLLEKGQNGDLLSSLEDNINGYLELNLNDDFEDLDQLFEATNDNSNDNDNDGDNNDQDEFKFTEFKEADLFNGEEEDLDDEEGENNDKKDEDKDKKDEINEDKPGDDFDDVEDFEDLFKDLDDLDLE